MRARSFGASIALAVALAACAPPSSTYVAAAATERAAWFVHRVSSGRETVDRVVECHEDRVPPCVRFEVVGVRDADWYAEWVAQSPRGVAPAAPVAPPSVAPTPPSGSTPPPVPAAPPSTPAPPAVAPTRPAPQPSAPRPPPAWTP